MQRAPVLECVKVCQPEEQYDKLHCLQQVVKRIWQHIREFGLQDPKDKRKIIPDEVLGTFLTAPVNMMTMNKQLSKHCFSKGMFYFSVIMTYLIEMVSKTQFGSCVNLCYGCVHHECLGHCSIST